MGERRKVLGRTSCYRLLVGALLIAAFSSVAMTAAPAEAQTTHKFLEYWDTPSGSGPEPQAVDREGNLYVYNGGDSTVSKYDPYGNPVEFSGLGSNTIDGTGGPNCPTIKADCDRVPTGDLALGLFNGTAKQVAVDISNGPAAGYIYVLNDLGGPINNIFEEPIGVIEVFSPTGIFLGEVDESKVYPRSAIDGGNYNDHSELIVDRNGHIYTAGRGQIDQFLPIDGVPEHDEFIGQIRGEIGAMGAGPTYTDVSSGTWFQYRASAYSIQTDPQPYLRSSKGCPTEFTGTLHIPPCGELWGDGGVDPDGNDRFANLQIDPRNEDVYLIRACCIEQWDKDSTHQIGPQFGNPYNAGNGLAFDVTGGPTDGRIYAHGGDHASDSVAVFSAPVHVPDVTYEPAIPGHTSFTVNAHVALDTGPEVTDCRIEYGLKQELELGNVPCAQATPYTADKQVTAVVSGLTTEKDYFYRVRVVTSNGTIYGERQKVHTVAVLAVSTEAATAITPTTAVLHGQLDPDGMGTEYHFEFGLTSDYDQATTEVIVPASSGVMSVAPTELTDLQAGRKYHYALFATNGLGTTEGNDQTFIAAGAPQISGVRTTDVSETSADLHAQINPLATVTTYRFEYGLTTGYGASIPVPEGELAASPTPVDVITHLGGLQAGFTYHFRVVATNQWGTTYGNDTTIDFFAPSCPNSHVRQLTSSNQLPDCRAYELVSPPEANGVVLFPGSMTADPRFGGIFDLTSPNSPYRLSSSNRGYAQSPSRLAFWGALGIVTGSDAPNTMIDMYVSSRSNTGWKTVYPGVPGKVSSGSGKPSCSDAMDRCLSYAIHGFFHFFGPEENLPWVWNTDRNSDFIEKWPTNHGAVPGSEDFVGDQLASGDFNHFVFSSRDLAFAPGGRESAPGSAYDNDIAKQTVEIISKLPNGEDIGQETPIASEFIQIASISPNGSHIMLTTNSAQGPENAYMRVGGAVTYQIGIGVRIIGMSRTGKQVLLSSNNRLNTEDTDTSSDIFMWRESNQSMTLVSKGGQNGNSDDCNSTWTGKCNAVIPATERKDSDSKYALESGDVVFYSAESLDPTRPGVPNQRNVYEARDGTVSLIGTLDPGTEIDRLQISPDGAHVAFLTRASMTGYNNVSCNYEIQTEFRGFEMTNVCKALEEMYSYDADRHTLTCVSCMRDGTPPTNDALASGGGLFMSDDGRPFFTTSDPLVPEDTNGIFDVYEYVDGRPQLISAGSGASDVYTGGFFYPPQRTGLETVSHDGTDVYFSTFDTLVPQDHNGNFVKFYDARANGGFPLDAGILPCKAADECHGPSSEAGAEQQVSTNADLGTAGNVAQGTTPVKKHNKAKRRKHKRHHKRRGSSATRGGGQKHG